MSIQTLHITNGHNLSDYLNQLHFKGDFLTWSEMLCEGPTNKLIDTPEFYKIRQQFFKSTYNLDYCDSGFKEELTKLEDVNTYDEVVLWFEYDLFCHINLIAVISLLEQKKCRIPLYLVCSGRVKGENQLKGLGELTPEQLLLHYDERVKLKVDDIVLAKKAWKIYTEGDHNNLKPLILRTSNFKYLSICLKAHIKRFADVRSGLSTLEYNILKLVKRHTITSRKHLVGYTLHYQGYYGFGDTQIKRIIDNLELFYNETESSVTLNRKGHLALEHQKNFFSQLPTDFQYGSTNKKDFQFDKKQNRLIKTVTNAN